MKWWFKLPLGVRTALAAAIGFVYAWFWILLGALMVYSEKSPLYPLFEFLGGFFSVFLYPWAFGGTLFAGFGLGAFFALTYLRKRLLVLFWLALSIVVGLWLTQKRAGQLPSLDELGAIAGLFDSARSLLMFGIPSVLFFLILLYWLVTPLPDRRPTVPPNS